MYTAALTLQHRDTMPAPQILHAQPQTLQTLTAWPQAFLADPALTYPADLSHGGRKAQSSTPALRCWDGKSSQRHRNREILSLFLNESNQQSQNCRGTDTPRLC